MFNAQEKLKELMAQREQLVAQICAFDGAIQLCQEIISKEKEANDKKED